MRWITNRQSQRNRRGPSYPTQPPGKRHCGRCHTCNTKLKSVLDGEEWCSQCGTYRRYRSHGWSLKVADQPIKEYCP